MASEQEVAAFGAQLSSRYGLRITNQRRTPEHNARVGGAKNSDHLTGLALDLGGDPKQMDALARWARANMGEGKMFRWVGWGDAGHKDHVHLSFNAAADIKADTVPAGTVSAASPTGAVVAEIDDLPPNATLDQIRDWVGKNQPDIAWMLSNPEIVEAVRKWANNDEPAARLLDRVRDTDYWRTHGPESRRFDTLIGTDPSEAGRVVDRAKAVVSDLFARYGVTADDTQVGTVAKNAIRSGWINLGGQVADPAAMQDFIAFALGNQGGVPVGETSGKADELMAAAKRYLVPISRSDAEAWALKMLTGSATDEVFTAWITGLAKARFHSQEDLVAAIEKGVAPADFFRSHVAQVAQRLNIAPETVDLTDPEWSWLTETVDDKGKRRAPTLTEVDQMARERPEYEDTDEYQQTYASLGVGLWKTLTGQSS